MIAEVAVHRKQRILGAAPEEEIRKFRAARSDTTRKLEQIAVAAGELIGAFEVKTEDAAPLIEQVLSSFSCNIQRS